ncbi:trypsin-like peptidase domain-containing protein [Agromyces sp. G08B096]|uniref:Trypsin-like peptidase domain-containing protein n=1 Tax=Agromyces sp. G08B096 TaxID=3156399 RepID=A0AAU7W9X0_9MICO
MTDNQHDPALRGETQGEPEELRQAAAAAPEVPAPVEEPATDATATSRPAAETAQQPAPAQPQPAAAAPAPQPQPPAQPTGTVYAPGQTPQPYHAPQYSHQPPAYAAPGATQPTQPLPGNVPPGSVPPAFGGPAAPAASEPKPRRAGFGIAAAIVAAALISGGAGVGVGAAVVSSQASSDAGNGGSSSPESIVVNDTDSVNQITAVAAKASPSVVTISVQGGQAGGTGSGIILSEDGYVLTNTHVVTLDGTTGDPAIQVKTNDGRLYTAELIGTDPLSDLAVIKLADASGLEPLEFADSDELNVGDTAIAIGAPLGLSGTVTNGIVSALNRSIDVQSSAAPETPDDSEGDDQEQQEGQSPFDFWNFDVPGEQDQQQRSASGGTISIPVIQTDAAINPGNSGGALLDAEGKLIGVNVAILSAGGSSTEAGNIGVGFAVPANLAERVAKELIENGSATHGLLGATVTSAQTAEDASTVGALITEVSQGGAAESAGLQAGDVVTEFNGIPITDQTDLTAQVRAQEGGAKAELTYVRDGEAKTVDVTLGTFEG